MLFTFTQSLMYLPINNNPQPFDCGTLKTIKFCSANSRWSLMRGLVLNNCVKQQMYYIKQIVLIMCKRLSLILMDMEERTYTP